MKVRVNKRHAELLVPERITSGSVGLTVELEFSNDWAGLAKTAVFTDLGSNTYDVLESSWGTGNVVEIPHELMTTAGAQVWLGVYGCRTEEDTTVLAVPTIYCKLGQVKPGADPSGDVSTDPTLSVWAQLQEDLDNVEDALAAEALARAAEDAGKQDTIGDLSAIRSGAAAGATALQAVPDTYRTAADQDAIDAGKQNKLTAGDGITLSADGTIATKNTYVAEYGNSTPVKMLMFIRQGAIVVCKRDGLVLPLIAFDGGAVAKFGCVINGKECIAECNVVAQTPWTYTETAISGGGGGGSTAWADITGKPSTFPPSSHTHAQSDVTGLADALAGKAAASHTHSYNALTDKPTIPAAVTDDHIAAVAATVVPSDDITANTDARHTHTNKTVLDGITAAKVAAWDACVADYTAALGVI